MKAPEAKPPSPARFRAVEAAARLAEFIAPEILEEGKAARVVIVVFKEGVGVLAWTTLKAVLNSLPNPERLAAMDATFNPWAS